MIYPDSAYAPVFEIYKRIPAHLKEKANAVLSQYSSKFKPGEAPPELMQQDLESIIKHHSPQPVYHTPTSSPHLASIPKPSNGVSSGEAIAAGILLLLAYII